MFADENVTPFCFGTASLRFAIETIDAVDARRLDYAPKQDD